MELEVKVTATTEVEVDVTVTRLTVDFRALRGHRAIGSFSATILSLNASTIRSRGTAFRSPRRIGSQARIRDSPPPSVWPTRTTSFFLRAACFSNTRARSCSTP
jgi:hypothetical protein